MSVRAEGNAAEVSPGMAMVCVGVADSEGFIVSASSIMRW
jgi:hypothetical protein